jgi:hypothetical protein
MRIRRWGLRPEELQYVVARKRLRPGYPKPPARSPKHIFPSRGQEERPTAITLPAYDSSQFTNLALNSQSHAIRRDGAENALYCTNEIHCLEFCLFLPP